MVRIVKKSKCKVCDKNISNSNILKHRISCTKVILEKNYNVDLIKLECNECGKGFKTVNGLHVHFWRMHTLKGRVFNPGRGFITGVRKSWNKGLTKETSSKVFAASLKLKGHRSNRKPLPIKSIDSIKKKNSLYMKKRIEQGFIPSLGKCKRYKVIDSFGRSVSLQGGYELRCSLILNKLGVRWERPKYLKYDVTRKYFPDFYLPDYNIYLDPKNDYLINLDIDKIRKVSSQNQIKVFILSEKQLNKNYIQGLLAGL